MRNIRRSFALAPPSRKNHSPPASPRNAAVLFPSSLRHMTDLSSSDRSAASAASPGAGAVPAAAPAAWWEDFMDIFYAPSQVYARRAGSGFGIPMLVVTVLVTALAIV